MWNTRRMTPWLLLSVGAVAAAYLPDLGRGFIRDDYAWIAGSRHDGTLAGWLDLFSRHNGFYRPLVAITFALNERTGGLEPYAFALTNFALVVGCMASIFALARALGLTDTGSLIAATLWGLNPHGIGGAILWISGRTSLLLTFFCVLAAVAAVKRRWLLLSIAYLAALFSKEEALLMSIVLVALAARPVIITAPHVPLSWLRAAIAVGLPCIVYLILRSRTDAMLPHSAPPHYQPLASASALARNVLEYADRAFTFPLAALLLTMVLARRWPRVGSRDRQRLTLCAAWILCANGLTVWVPVRSSLYVCLPLVGASIIAATLIDDLVRRVRPRTLPLAVAAVTVCIVMVPIHRSRNVRLRRMAELSASVFQDLRAVGQPAGGGALIILHDAVGERYNIEKAFGTLIVEALGLATGGTHSDVWINPPVSGWDTAGLRPPDGRPAVHYWLRSGRLVQLPSSAR